MTSDEQKNFDAQMRATALQLAVSLGETILNAKVAGGQVSDTTVVAAAQVFYDFLKGPKPT